VSVAWPEDEALKFGGPVNFMPDADEAVEDSDPGGLGDRERRGFPVQPVDYQDDPADFSARPNTGADDLDDFSNYPNFTPSFPPSFFDPEPAPRGPLAREKELDPQILNNAYEANGAQRLKNMLNPQRAFAMIFELEVLVPYTELYCTLWNEVAIQHDLPSVTEDEVSRVMSKLGVDATIKEFQWTFDRATARGFLTDFQARLKSAVQDKTRLATFAKASVGATRWLDLLKDEEIHAAIVGHHNGDVLRDLVDAAGLTGFTIVSVEDNLDSLEQAFLSAAAKLEMAPSACCTFGASPTSVISAHQALMRGVSVAGVYPRYELTVSDLIIDSFEDMNIDKVRVVMSTNEIPDWKLEPLPQPEPDRYAPR
jgi:beta-phosphoglucomutase-like phosphatase (HAD superfamily)